VRKLPLAGSGLSTNSRHGKFGGRVKETVGQELGVRERKTRPIVPIRRRSCQLRGPKFSTERIKKRKLVGVISDNARSGSTTGSSLARDRKIGGSTTVTE